jgi:hypothetical protein
VLEPDDLPELAVEVEHHAVLQVVRRCHARGACLFVDAVPGMSGGAGRV